MSGAVTGECDVSANKTFRGGWNRAIILFPIRRSDEILFQFSLPD